MDRGSDLVSQLLVQCNACKGRPAIDVLDDRPPIIDHPWGCQIIRVDVVGGEGAMDRTNDPVRL